MCYLILTNAGGKFRENILIHINYFYLRKIDVEEQTLLRISRNESKQIFITPTCETHKSVQLARATIFSSFSTGYAIFYIFQKNRNWKLVIDNFLRRSYLLLKYGYYSTEGAYFLCKDIFTCLFSCIVPSPKVFY